MKIIKAMVFVLLMSISQLSHAVDWTLEKPLGVVQIQKPSHAMYIWTKGGSSETWGIPSCQSAYVILIADGPAYRDLFTAVNMVKAANLTARFGGSHCQGAYFFADYMQY